MFAYTNVMFLDCVESFSVSSSARDRRTMDSTMASQDIRRPGKRLERICKMDRIDRDLNLFNCI